MYHISFPQDIRWIKVLVYTLFAIDTLQTVRRFPAHDSFRMTDLSVFVGAHNTYAEFYFYFSGVLPLRFLLIDNAWHFLAKGWGDPEALIKPGWSWIAVPLISGIVSCTVQWFFSWRIWKLSGKWYVSIFICAVSF